MTQGLYACVACCLIFVVHAGTIPEQWFQSKEEGAVRYHGRRLLNSTDTGSTVVASKSFWDKIKEFYDDKNNFAMYLVLPLIIIVYGGCSLIYCIAKCRRYLKRKKNTKSMSNINKDDCDDDDDGPETTNRPADDSQNEGGAAAAAAVNANEQRRPGSKARSTSDVRVDGVERQNSTPLPWQVPDETEALCPKKEPEERKSSSRNDQRGYDNRAMRREQPRQEARTHSRNEIRHHQSPPPPYEDHDIDEIPMIPTGAPPLSKKEPLQDRPVVSQHGVNVVSNRGNDPTRMRNAMESYNMAKQAAELLRLDEKHRIGRNGYGKQKRLIFVAE